MTDLMISREEFDALPLPGLGGGASLAFMRATDCGIKTLEEARRQLFNDCVSLEQLHAWAIEAVAANEKGFLDRGDEL